ASGPFRVRPVRRHLHGRWFGRPPACAGATPQRLRCVPCRVQRPTGSSSYRCGVRADPLCAAAGPSGGLVSSAGIAPAPSTPRVARTSDSVLTGAPAALVLHIGRTRGRSVDFGQELDMRPIVFFFTAAFGLAVGAASAGEYKAGSLEISDPWSRATPKG